MDKLRQKYLESKIQSKTKRIARNNEKIIKKTKTNWTIATQYDDIPQAMDNYSHKFPSNGKCRCKDYCRASGDYNEICDNADFNTECTIWNCNPGEKNCGNRDIQKGINKCLSVKKTDKKGLGLFTTENISFKTKIICYIGRVVQTDNTNNSKNYCMQINAKISIDAYEYSNFACFANDSCNPNMKTELWDVCGVPYLVFVALENIKQKQELTIDYNGDCYGLRTFDKSHFDCDAIKYCKYHD
eukprot:276208_1